MGTFGLPYDANIRTSLFEDLSLGFKENVYSIIAFFCLTKIPE